MPKKNIIFNLDELNNWKEEWKSMPEFIQEDKQPIQKIQIKFNNIEEVQEFAKLTGYRITNKTKSIWFPYREKDKPSTFSYIDSNE
jgi:hypothetical protein